MQSNCGSLATWILLPPPGIDALSTSLVPSKPHPNYSSVYDSTPGQLTIQKFPLILYHSKLDTEVTPSTVPGGCPTLTYRLYRVRTLSRVGCMNVSDARIGSTPRCIAEDMPYIFLFYICPDNFKLPRHLVWSSSAFLMILQPSQSHVGPNRVRAPSIPPSEHCPKGCTLLLEFGFFGEFRTPSVNACGTRLTLGLHSILPSVHIHIKRPALPSTYMLEEGGGGFAHW